MVRLKCVFGIVNNRTYDIEYRYYCSQLCQRTDWSTHREFHRNRNSLACPETQQQRKFFLNKASSGDWKAVERLVLGGFDTMTVDEAGYAAIHLASSHGHLKVLGVLIDGGPPELLDCALPDGSTALILAAQSGHLNVVCELAKRRADLLAKRDNGESCLFVAAKAGKTDVVRFLIKEDPSLIPIVTAEGASCLYAASGHGHTEVVSRARRARAGGCAL